MDINSLYALITRFSNLDPTFRAFVIGVLVFLAALWIGLIVWTARDVSARTRSTIARIVAVLMVFVLHLFGFFVYLLFRPSQTLAEREDLALEHDLLLQASMPAPAPAESRHCDDCGTVLEDDFLFCPQCRTQVRRTCAKCGRLLELAWRNCPFCGKAVSPTKKA